MRLIGAGIAMVFCASGLAAQEIKTTVTQKTTFEVKEGHDLKVSGCVQSFEDAGYMLTDDAGQLKYVLVTNDNLNKYVGRRVEVHGLGTDGDDGRIEIEREVGTSGVIGGEKLDGPTMKQTKEVTGDVGFGYVSVKSLKKLADSCP
jgi:hypothetical protein